MTETLDQLTARINQAIIEEVDRRIRAAIPAEWRYLIEAAEDKILALQAELDLEKKLTKYNGDRAAKLNFKMNVMAGESQALADHIAALKKENAEMRSLVEIVSEQLSRCRAGKKAEHYEPKARRKK